MEPSHLLRDAQGAGLGGVGWAAGREGRPRVHKG